VLHGFTPPFTPDGRSALAPAPPWHYAGWIFSIEYAVSAERAAAFLPPGFGRATGRAALHFADWQATSDGSELLDPAYAQYKECFVLVDAERDGAPANFCPLIYVDQDVSLVRGWLQGLPKKLGSVWMTRSYGLDHPAAAPMREGTRLGASLAVKDRRLAEAILVANGRDGERIGFFAQPSYGLVGLPSLVGGAEAARPQLVRLAADTRLFGPSWSCSADLRLLDSPRDDLHALAPDKVLRASASLFALTVSKVDAAAG
jgi:hypothetical protein